MERRQQQEQDRHLAERPQPVPVALNPMPGTSLPPLELPLPPLLVPPMLLLELVPLALELLPASGIGGATREQRARVPPIVKPPVRPHQEHIDRAFR